MSKYTQVLFLVDEIGFVRVDKVHVYNYLEQTYISDSNGVIFENTVKERFDT